jgi:hypothetical protein
MTGPTPHRSAGGLAGLGALAALMLVAAAGCSRGNPASTPTTNPAPTSASPTDQPSGTATATTGPPLTPIPPASNVVEFSVDGAGPYLLGQSLAALQAGPGLDAVANGSSAGCPENTIANGKGVWAGVKLSFRKDGLLYLAVNTSPSIPTPSGAWLGTGLTDLKRIYAAIPGQELAHGGDSAYLVTTLSGRGILFTLSSSHAVTSMSAGDAAYLKANFTTGASFC